MNILFSSPGRRVALILAFRNSLLELNIVHKLFGHELKEDAPGLQFLDHISRAPSIHSSQFKGFLLDYVGRYKIDLIIPTIDPELMILANMAKELKSLNLSLIHI